MKYWNFECRICHKNVEWSYYSSTCNGCGADEQNATENKNQTVTMTQAATENIPACPFCGIEWHKVQEYDKRTHYPVMVYRSACHCEENAEAGSLGEAFLNSRPTGV